MALPERGFNTAGAFPGALVQETIMQDAMTQNNLKEGRWCNFILCPSFHGATLLSRFLVSHPNIVCLGDSLPIKAFRHSDCSCGLAYLECDFWRRIEADFDCPRYAPEPYLMPIQPRFTQHPLANTLLYRSFLTAAQRLGPWVWSLAGAPARRFREDYVRFAQLTCELQAKRTYVDGAKAVRRFEVLRSMMPAGVPFRVLHITRSPMGFYHSCRKHGELEDIAACAAVWKESHEKIQQSPGYRKHCEYKRVRYEDFCQSPQAVMDEIVRFFGEPAVEFTQELMLNATHHIRGNASLRKFDGTVESSESWRDSISPEEQKRLLDMTMPLSEKYGYR